MPKTGGKPIEPGLVARVSGAVQGAIKGAAEAWFGPGRPISPVAPEDVRGRAFDYPVAFNLPFKPRSETGENSIGFDSLRALADPVNGGLDVLRCAIETRKDQMEAQRWAIRGRDESDGGPRARELEKILRMPDLEHTFSQWQRMLLEDLLVIDAPTVYLAPSSLGHLVPQVMDGALLKRLLTPDGRTPLAPAPAFIQTLKGLPAVEYSVDELVRMPRNLRSYKAYGMSPVEQVVMTVNIALRRQLSQLEYYTAGSVPDVLLATPESWSADQIRQFQTWWDSVLSGNTEERRRARFIPFGVKPFPLKEPALKDEFDEWLARLVCYAFSLSPQWATKQMNRATAETAKEAAQEEGLEPLKLWWSDFMGAVLAKGYGEPELEFVYIDEEIANPVDKANVASLAVGKKPWKTVDEVRADYGMDPLTPEQKDELAPPPPPPVLAPGATPPKPGDPVEEDPGSATKLRKSRRSL